MPLPALNAPPLRTPLVDKDGRISHQWAQWFEILWRKTGAETTVAPLSIEGTAQQAVAIPPTVVSSGAPTQDAPPGVYAVDEDTGDIYYNPTGQGGDWLLL